MRTKKDHSNHSLPEISSFSKHLMLVIIAVFAMLTPILNSSKNEKVQYLLYLTVLLGLISFYYGHKVLTRIITLYANPEITNIIFDDIRPIIQAMSFQLIISGASVIFLIITYGFHTMNTTQNIATTTKKIESIEKLVNNNSTIIKSNQTRLNIEENRNNDNLKRVEQIIINYKKQIDTIKLLISDQSDIKHKIDLLRNELNMIKRKIDNMKNRTNPSTQPRERLPNSTKPVGAAG